MEKKARTRLIIVIAIVLVLLAVLLYVSASSGSSLSYFKTVSELKKDKSLVGKTIRVGGEVVKGSVVRKTDYINFTLTDQKSRIGIIYRGTIPSAFGEGLQVIAEGTYEGGKSFEAKSLITKCPSKYQSQKIQAK